MIVRWFYYLVPGEDEKRVALLDNCFFFAGNLIICRDKGNKQFAKFSSFLEYARFYFKETPVIDRYDFEVIMGDFFQKPYFDIDIKRRNDEMGRSSDSLTLNESTTLIKELVKIIEKTILKIGDKEGTIMVFTSHSAEKLSYHIIVDGWCLSDHKENRAFHDLIMKDFSLPSIVDHSVYSNIRQLRMYQSRKFGSERIKILDNELTYNIKTCKNGYTFPIKPESEDHAELMILGSSLVGNTRICRILPTLFIPPPARIFSGTPMDSLTEEDIDNVMIIAKEKLPSFPFNLLKVEDRSEGSTLIVLKRLGRSRCDICDRTHEHENPYLIVYGEERSISFDCRRSSDNKRLYLGKLGIKNISTATAVPKIIIPDKITPLSLKSSSSSIFEDLNKIHFSVPKKEKPITPSSGNYEAFKRLHNDTFYATSKK
jgi:hypothetical protein